LKEVVVIDGAPLTVIARDLVVVKLLASVSVTVKVSEDSRPLTVPE